MVLVVYICVGVGIAMFLGIILMHVMYRYRHRVMFERAQSAGLPLNARAQSKSLAPAEPTLNNSSLPIGV
jgi:hypothetical protein